MFSIPDVAVILAVVLIVFGPGKLPEIGSSLGQGIRNFKKASEEELPELHVVGAEKVEPGTELSGQEQPPEKPAN